MNEFIEDFKKRKFFIQIALVSAILLLCVVVFSCIIYGIVCLVCTYILSGIIFICLGLLNCLFGSLVIGVFFLQGELYDD